MTMQIPGKISFVGAGNMGEALIKGLINSGAMTPQQIGSAITYLRRQSLMTAVGISTDLDDDGAASSKPAAFAPSTSPAAPRPLTK